MRFTYGETVSDAAMLNLKGQVFKVEDQSSVRQSLRFDIHGYCLEDTFQATQEYKQVVDWRTTNALEGAVYSHTWVYNNLGQVLEEKDAQGNHTRRSHDRRGCAKRVEFMAAKTGLWTSYLTKATFEADGLPSPSHTATVPRQTSLMMKSRGSSSPSRSHADHGMEEKFWKT